MRPGDFAQMKTMIMAAACLVAACLAAVCLTLATGPGAAPRAQTASARMAGAARAPRPAASRNAARLPVAHDCLGWRRGQVRARSIALSCFGSVVLKVTGWKYWTGVSARSAKATLGVDDCKPDCVSGRFRRYAATVVLYRARSHDGTRYFSRLRIQYRHAGPRRYTYRWAKYPGARIPVWTGGPRARG
jgi:hypothetical protein